MKKTKTQEQVFNQIWKHEFLVQFRNKDKVKARNAIEGEKIEIFQNGVLESVNIAKKDDVIIQHKLNGKEIISKKDFSKKYNSEELGENFKTFRAKGKVWATEYMDDTIEFFDRTGKKTLLEKGDMLCTPTVDDPGEFYAVKFSVFFANYEWPPSGKENIIENVNDETEKPILSSLKNKIQTVKNSLSEPIITSLNRSNKIR